MSDYGASGAEPVEDAVAEDPPTEQEVRAEQERRHPRQAATARHGDPRPDLAGPGPADGGGPGAEGTGRDGDEGGGATLPPT